MPPETLYRSLHALRSAVRENQMNALENAAKEVYMTTPRIIALWLAEKTKGQLSPVETYKASQDWEESGEAPDVGTLLAMLFDSPRDVALDALLVLRDLYEDDQSDAIKMRAAYFQQQLESDYE